MTLKITNPRPKTGVIEIISVQDRLRHVYTGDDFEDGITCTIVPRVDKQAIKNYATTGAYAKRWMLGNFDAENRKSDLKNIFKEYTEK